MSYLGDLLEFLLDVARCQGVEAGPVLHEGMVSIGYV